jgi:2-polyprenyl-3-methyl-5-hydroxy-6-metoxy-1,4-benzoquinol methylase
MKTSHIVEGYGPLDVFLAKQRYKVAKREIYSAKKSGRILDIGCGSHPLFLTSVNFTEKYGLDKNIEACVADEMKKQGIVLINHYIEKEEKLPFKENFFDVVSMLAVFEHIEPEQLVRIHREINRILKPGGIYVMTTPAFWTEGLLKFLAKLRLISGISISEHKDSYDSPMVSSILQEAGFPKNNLRFGYFELFMNMWTTAVK